MERPEWNIRGVVCLAAATPRAAVLAVIPALIGAAVLGVLTLSAARDASAQAAKGPAPTAQAPNAQAPGSRTGDSFFRRLDANGDGMITFDELSAAGDERVGRFDLDRDGRISRTEFIRYHERRAQILADEALAGKSGGGVRRGDARGLLKRHFVEIDADRDGKLTRVEMLAALKARASALADRIFVAFDTDRDGYITKAERDAMNRTRFRQLDANGDGRITLSEMGVARERSRSRRRADD